MAAVRQPLCLYFSKDAVSAAAEVRTAFQALNRPCIVGGDPGARDIASRSQIAVECCQSHPRQLLGLLVPHGAACDGFFVAAHAYQRLCTHLQRVQCKHLTAVMLGTEHRSTTPIALSRLDWQMPLGQVPTDTAAVDWLQQQHGIPVAEAPHAAEHSIENQLPFLQLAASCCWDPLTAEGTGSSSSSTRAATLSIVPISVGYLGQQPSLISQYGRAVAQLLQHLRQRQHEQQQQPDGSSQVVLIVTTDFTHAGPWYRELPPPGLSLADYMMQQDAPLLQAIQHRSVQELLAAAAATHNSLCGLYPLAVALSALYGADGGVAEADVMEADSPELLTYQAAHQIFHRPDSTGFAAFAMYALGSEQRQHH